MSDLDVLVNMKSEALITRICMSSTDIGESLAAQEEYHVLVERFFTKYPNQAASDQVPLAKEDTDYFVALLDTAIQYYRKKSKEGL
jgi:hypothetical protein